MLAVIAGITRYFITRQKTQAISFDEKRDEALHRLMNEGDIPGLSLITIRNGRQQITNYGYEQVASRKPVTDHTLFELGSCSKAFTALAVMKLVADSAIHLEEDVSAYIPWFHVKYKDSVVKLSIRQVLHQTSGIPWKTIALIPEGDHANALEETIRRINGIALHHLPGKQYEYATINYDLLALVIQYVTKQTFEEYVSRQILQPLHLFNTTIGEPLADSLMATGYKISFFNAREYQAPRFGGNNAAGYIISDAADMAKWLNFQLGADSSELYRLAMLTRQRDETVPLHNMAAYAMGWNVSLNGDQEVYHDGRNPNFTAYVALRPSGRTGVAVLANANSSYTPVIGDHVMKLLMEEENEKQYNPGDGNDNIFSVLSIIIGLYELLALAFLVYMFWQIVAGKRKYAAITAPRIMEAVSFLVLAVPFLLGIYWLPAAVADASWKSVVVWMPLSFPVLIGLLLAAIATSYLIYFTGILFPEQNRFLRILPRITLISILSGISNMIVITLITAAIGSDVTTSYLVFYYALALCVYLLGRRFVQISLIKFTRDLIYDLRLKIIDKVFSTSYQKFEKVDRGKVYTALNDDVNTIGDAANMVVMLITSIFTILGIFFYLGFIGFWVALLTVLLIIAISTIYFLVSKKANTYFEEARTTQNTFVRLVNGMIDGFKEISMHNNKKLEYKEDVAETANQYRQKIASANIRFVNAFMVGESLLVVLLGVVVFALPRLFDNIDQQVIMSFVIVLLYLIGPINSTLNAIPSIMRIRIAWNRIRQFLAEIPADQHRLMRSPQVPATVESIRLEGVQFRYGEGEESHQFGIGPIDLEVRRGEVLFIIGGNGSGKTTLAKLLTGLYEPDEGRILVNDEVMESGRLGEYFSAVFNPAHLFEKLYNIDLKNRTAELQRYLYMLELDKKVEITDNRYNTINLSGGQRKRLALLQCYLEGAPVYLFDEWAADQDPAYRQFFYKVLLPEMKAAGKIVIAITHDDQYFNAADSVWKMNEGRLECLIPSENLITR